MISLPVTIYSVALVGAAAGVLTIFIGAAFYDITLLRLFRPLRSHPHAAPYRRRPLVSVVFITRNNEKTITDSLRSAYSGSYRHVEVIVVDNASSDGTVDAVRGFVRANPKRAVKLVTKRAKAPENDLLQVIRRVSHGELVMVVRAGASLDYQAVKAALQYFLVNDSLQALHGRRAVIPEPSIVNQAKQLGTIISARLAKAQAGFGFQPGRSQVVVYRRPALTVVVSPRYASNVVVMNQHALRTIPPRAALFKTLFWLAWVLPAASVGYIWYVALYLHVVEPLGVLWLAATLGGLLFTLGDDYVTIADKLRAVSVVPLWYLFSCIYLLLRVLSPLEIFTRVRVSIRLVPERD